MKKKEEKSQGLTIQFLEKKYQQEKLILVKENNKLVNQLNQEIEQVRAVTQKFQFLELKNQQLRREVQMLKGKNMELERHEEDVSVNEEEQFQILQEHKTLMVTNTALELQKQELQSIVEKIYSEKQQLKYEIERKEEENHAALEILQSKHEEFKRQIRQREQEFTQKIQMLIHQNQILSEEKSTESSKYSELKKKKKDLEKKMEELEKKTEILSLDQDRLEEQLAQMKKQNQKEHQKFMELNTKYTLGQSKITNLENYINKKQEQYKDLEKKTEIQEEQLQKYQRKLQKLQNYNKQLKEQNYKEIQMRERLQTQMQKELKERNIRALRRNETEELIGLIKGTNSDISNKNLQKFVQTHEYRQGTSSQSDMQSMSRPMLHQPSDERNLEKTKLEMVINSLESQLSQSRKQMQSLNYDLTRLKRSNEDKSLEVQRKQGQIRQYRLKIDKLENDRNKELISLRNQNQVIKNRETEHLERARQFEEYKNAISLKLTFYQRKIKQHIDTVDRKQTIIEKLQLQKNQTQDKHKLFQDHLRKLSDEVDFLRKFKQDCNRKDELMKDYRSKLQKVKTQAEQSKNELNNVKKEKQRLEKQVQSKQQYINMLKTKQQKQQKMLDKVDEQKQNKKLHQLRNGYENKLLQIKKQKEHLLIGLSDIRQVMMTKVEELIAKNLPKGKKQKTPQYEAAKLLGIKSSDLQEFINPNSSMNKKISKQLQELWMEGNYAEFVLSYTDYLASQKQT